MCEITYIKLKPSRSVSVHVAPLMTVCTTPTPPQPPPLSPPFTNSIPDNYLCIDPRPAPRTGTTGAINCSDVNDACASLLHPLPRPPIALRSRCERNDGLCDETARVTSATDATGRVSPLARSMGCDPTIPSGPVPYSSIGHRAVQFVLHCRVCMLRVHQQTIYIKTIWCIPMYALATGALGVVVGQKVGGLRLSALWYT